MVICSTFQERLHRTFFDGLELLSEALKKCIYWPSKIETKNNLPNYFVPHFTNVRAVLDCTEMSIQMPKCLSCKIQTYSHYKGKQTAKYLISVSPAGLIINISNGYGGKASDKFIVNEEKILDRFEEKDEVMVDKGFCIDHETMKKGVKLVRPHFLHGHHQFTGSQSFENVKIAQARVHVERAIGRMKMFKILQDRIDLNIISHLDEIMTIIAAVVNMSGPIIGEDKF